MRTTRAKRARGAAGERSRQRAAGARPPSIERALAALARDLAHLAALGVGAPVVPAAAFELARRIRALTESEPRALAGVLYVLEGSKLGGLVQAAALSKVPGLEGAGREYLSASGRDTRAAFRQFVVRLDAALRDDASAALRGAIAAFEGFAAIVFALSGAPRAARGSA